MSANLVALWYLVASVCFILALKGLSHPETARRGNYFGMAGMTMAPASAQRTMFRSCGRLIGVSRGTTMSGRRSFSMTSAARATRLRERP